jgi:hypothetical protein
VISQTFIERDVGDAVGQPHAGKSPGAARPGDGRLQRAELIGIDGVEVGPEPGAGDGVLSPPVQARGLPDWRKRVRAEKEMLVVMPVDPSLDVEFFLVEEKIFGRVSDCHADVARSAQALPPPLDGMASSLMAVCVPLWLCGLRWIDCGRFMSMGRRRPPRVAYAGRGRQFIT